MKKDFKILMPEFAEETRLRSRPGSNAAARAEDGGAGSIKSGAVAQASAHVGKPLDTLPKQEEARRDLGEPPEISKRVSTQVSITNRKGDGSGLWEG